MEPNPQVESQLVDIRRRLDQIESRLAVLESGAESRARARASPGHTPSDAATPRPLQPASVALPLVGRTLVVLGGAFLLRAITEARIVTLGLGTTLGITYAVAWILMGWRAGGRGARASAGFHGLAAAVVAYPLVWETTSRFALLRPIPSAMLLGALTAVGLYTAWRVHLRAMSWTFTLGAAATAIALAFATREHFLYTAVILLLGLATLWIGYVRDWHGLAWLTALLSDAWVLVLGLTVSLAHAPGRDAVLTGTQLVLLQLGLAAIYIPSVAARVLVRGRDIGIPEAVQTTAVLAIGLGGAIATQRITGAGGPLLAGVSATLATACYAIVFAILDQRVGSRRNFIFFSTIALIFTLTGSEAIFSGAALALTLAALALITTSIGARAARATLSLHGAIYCVGAAVVAGLPAYAFRLWIHSTSASSVSPSATVLLVLGTVAVCSWFPVATHGRTWGRLSRLPKLVVLSVLCVGIGTLVVAAGVALLPTADAAVIAALRTGVLAATALALARARRWARYAEAAFLLYPVLIAGGAKLLFEDLRTGRPVTLVFSLVFYGTALILAPRRTRRR